MYWSFQLYNGVCQLIIFELDFIYQFQPSLASKKSCGLSQLIYYSVLKCDEKIRPELLSNITLSGE